MAEKTGAGGKPQEFDAENGRYVKGSGQGYNSQSDIQPLRKAVEKNANKAFALNDQDSVATYKIGRAHV